VTEAVAELRRCAGTHFDPVVVEVLCDRIAAGLAPVSSADRGDPTPLDPTLGDPASGFGLGLAPPPTSD
jgi:hypothetical protein